MLSYLIPLGIVVVVVALIAWFLHSIHKNYEKMSTPEDFITEAAPVVKTEAVIVGMHIANQMLREYFTPEHRTQYLVTFKLPDGTEKTLEVDESSYDSYAVSQAGELITLNNNLLDFIVAKP